MPATQHQHHFDDLSPDDFERVIYWLVKRSGEFDQVQYYGGARDKGRDVVAYRHTPAGRAKWYFQAKRYVSISFPTLKEELDKLAGHAKAEPDFSPDVIVFVTACDVPPQARDQAEAYARDLGLPAPHYWGRLELDEKVKRQRDIVEEFFQDGRTPAVLIDLATVEDTYRQRLVAAYGRLVFAGFERSDLFLSEVPLEKVFVRLSLTVKKVVRERGGGASELGVAARKAERGVQREDGDHERRQERVATVQEPVTLAGALRQNVLIVASQAPARARSCAGWP
jgi:Restriction endonuclease